MGIEAKTNNYWIAPNAISISLNALGDENRIQGSVTSGSVISCYIESVKPESAGEAYAGNGDGLGLDNGRNPKRWLLTISPTYFNSDTPKYVYVAIPRRASFGTQAIVVFPSEQIDIYGKNENDEQIGSVDYFYIWLRGIISAPVEKDGTLQREWTQQIVWGSLGTYEDIVDMSESDWYTYTGANGGSVTFLKKIIMKTGSFFQNIFLGDQDHELTGVATAATEDEYIDSDTLVATPNFISQHYLRKDADDEAAGLIGFVKGLWIKAAGLFGFSEGGDVVARSIKATGSNGGTVADIDNATRKNLGLEVTESGIIGGILRVAKSILTKTIQSINFTGGDSLFGTGWQLTDNDGNGNSRLIVDNLFVRAKAVFNELEVRKFVAMAGNYVFSPAASIIEEVDYIHYVRDAQTGEVTGEEVLGYTYIKVPWVLRLIPLSLLGKILSKKKLVRTTISASDLSQVNVFRCWLRSDDGTTRTINTWKEGMLARCQTFNMASGSEASHTGTWNEEQGGKSVTNKLYWRAVTGVGEAKTKDNYDLENHILEDGLTHNYIDLSNDEGMFLAGSDMPEALDHIVCFGDWKDRELSNLIMVETVGSEAPCIREMLGVGYTDGTSISWSLSDNQVRTRISPKVGNKFVAPSFIVTNDNDMTGEALYNENIKGPAYRYDQAEGQATIIAPDGSVVLLAYNDIETDYALKICTTEPQTFNPATGLPSGGGTSWTMYKANLGDAYVNQQDGHRYVATATGWEDRGLNDESKSTLKVDINGISAIVEAEIGGLATALNLSSSQIALVSLVNFLEAAGVHIDGQSSSIKLKAGKVDFVDPNGDPYQTPKVWINTATGALHVVDGFFNGALSGVTGTFSGSISSIDELIQLTSSAVRDNVEWRGLAVMGREEGVVNLGDIATFGARIYSNKSYGRIALSKRVVTRSGDTITVTTTIPITLDADEGLIEATAIEASKATFNDRLQCNALVGTNVHVYEPTALEIIQPTSNTILVNNGGSFLLPTRSYLAQKLGSNNFALELNIIISGNVNSSVAVYGRYADYTDCPYLRRNDYTDVGGGLVMERGNVLTLMLVASGTLYDAFIKSTNQ